MGGEKPQARHQHTRYSKHENVSQVFRSVTVFCAAVQVETLTLVDKVDWDQAAWRAPPAANYITRGVSLKGSVPGGIRSRKEQGVGDNPPWLVGSVGF